MRRLEFNREVTRLASKQHMLLLFACKICEKKTCPQFKMFWLVTEKERFYLQPGIIEWQHDLAFDQIILILFLLYFVILGYKRKHTKATAVNILPQILHPWLPRRFLYYIFSGKQYFACMICTIQSFLS